MCIGMLAMKQQGDDHSGLAERDTRFTDAVPWTAQDKGNIVNLLYICTHECRTCDDISLQACTAPFVHEPAAPAGDPV